jgi:hypothetical protein
MFSKWTVLLYCRCMFMSVRLFPDSVTGQFNDVHEIRYEFNIIGNHVCLCNYPLLMTAMFTEVVLHVHYRYSYLCVSFELVCKLSDTLHTKLQILITITFLSQTLAFLWLYGLNQQQLTVTTIAAYIYSDV